MRAWSLKDAMEIQHALVPHLENTALRGTKNLLFTVSTYHQIDHFLREVQANQNENMDIENVPNHW